MSSMKEIKSHIKSVQDTQKITNAMYLIASAKLRKAKEDLSKTRPYFSSLRADIKRVFRTANEANSIYFYPENTDERPLNGTYACLVITADKGMAGAYNQNIIKAAENMIKDHPDTRLFVVGERGRQYFQQKHIPIEEDFLYTSQNNAMYYARRIAYTLLDLYDKRQVDKIFVIYTDVKNSLFQQVIEERLLPFHHNQFFNDQEKPVETPFEFYPSLDAVIQNIVKSYVVGYIHSALVDSFCSEQNARMNAMSSANRNAEKLLSELSVEYQRVRQSAITKEITEISSGAKAQRQRRLKKAKEVLNQCPQE